MDKTIWLFGKEIKVSTILLIWLISAIFCLLCINGTVYTWIMAIKAWALSSVG